ncbi:hypothetical protein ACGFT2_33685 [Streptomyces sp. NPDC048514]|uniref:hypothetical protein n=1 Tax=Streptomyces sp. NPDC048514 TaxID=3365564 RepID=UPI00370FE278
MAAEANSARITGKIQGRDILLDGPLSKDEIRDRVWWWQTPHPQTTRQQRDLRHEYDDSRRDVITTLGGYYEVPRDRHTPEAHELTDMLHAELNPDE